MGSNSEYDHQEFSNLSTYVAQVQLPVYLG